MSIPRLELGVDREDGVYRAGDRVRGVVTLAVPGAYARAVNVSLAWRTRGEGNVERGGEHLLRSPIPEPDEDGRVRIPFELALPLGPISYAGKLLHIEWFVAAEIDIAWDIDPRVELQIQVLRALAPAGYRSVAAPVRHQLGPQVKAAGTRKIIERGSGAAMLAFFGSSIASLYVEHLIWIVAPVALLGTIVYEAARRRRREDALGSPRIELDRVEVHAGDVIAAQVILAPLPGIQIDDLEAELTCIERVTRGHGSSSSIRQEDVLRTTIAFAPAEPAPGSDALHYPCRVTIPRRAPPSFGASDNEVTWSIKFTLRAHHSLNDEKFWVAEEVLLVVHP